MTKKELEAEVARLREQNKQLLDTIQRLTFSPPQFNPCPAPTPNPVVTPYVPPFTIGDPINPIPPYRIEYWTFNDSSPQNHKFDAHGRLQVPLVDPVIANNQTPWGLQ